MYREIAIGSVFALFILILGIFIYNQPQPTGTVYGCLEKGIPKEAELECRHIREFKHPVMKDGCVYQESHGQVIKTCG
jgi:hypothetical protein